MPDAARSGSPMVSKRSVRRRYVSEDLYLKARRFGTPVTVLFTTNPETLRKQVEVMVHMSRFKPAAPPLVFVIELRRLFFWACMLLLVASAGAFRVMPRGPMARTPMSASPVPSAIENTPAVAVERAVVGQARADAELLAEGAPTHIINPLMDEAAIQLGKVGQDAFGADSFDVMTVSSQALSLFAEGEFTVEKLKVYFSRACLSALMHKVVGTGVTLASACMVHH